MGISSPAPSLSAPPLELFQARFVVTSCLHPMLIADVTEQGFNVLAISPLFRRFVVGARHPSGPLPGEAIDPSGFGALADVLVEAAKDPTRQQTMELPVGDEPDWYDLVVTPLSSGGTCRQVVVAASLRPTADDGRHQRLRGQRRRDALVAHSPHLGFLLDSVGRIHSCNDSVREVLGLAPNTLAGQPIFALLHPDSASHAMNWFDQVRASPGREVTVPDLGFTCSDGAHLWFDATATNLLHDDNVAAVVLAAWDVTQRRQREQRLQLALSTDAVTGLASLASMLERLGDEIEHAHRAGKAVRLFALNIVGLGALNRRLGVELGDRLLIAVANRLTKMGAPPGLCASSGGGRFALAIVADSAQPTLSEDRLRQAFAEPVVLDQHRVEVAMKIGSADSIAAQAPRALYWAADSASHYEQ